MHVVSFISLSEKCMAPYIRYALHKEYGVDFFGEELFVTVTHDSYKISQWIRAVPNFPHPLVVGVGVQWTPLGFYSENSLPECNYYAPEVDTLQLCVRNHCIIIQLSHCDCVPDDLRSFLENEETRFVGVWNGQDARRLKESRHELLISDLMDLRKYVVDSYGRSMKGYSFEEIVQVCLGRPGVSLDRAVSMSDWSAFNLCDHQILQASIDAFVWCKLAVHYRLWRV